MVRWANPSRPLSDRLGTRHPPGIGPESAKAVKDGSLAPQSGLEWAWPIRPPCRGRTAAPELVLCSRRSTHSHLSISLLACLHWAAAAASRTSDFHVSPMPRIPLPRAPSRSLPDRGADRGGWCRSLHSTALAAATGPWIAITAGTVEKAYFGLLTKATDWQDLGQGKPSNRLMPGIHDESLSRVRFSGSDVLSPVMGPPGAWGGVLFHTSDPTGPAADSPLVVEPFAPFPANGLSPHLVTSRNTHSVAG